MVSSPNGRRSCGAGSARTPPRCWSRPRSRDPTPRRGSPASTRRRRRGAAARPSTLNSRGVRWTSAPRSVAGVGERIEHERPGAEHRRSRRRAPARQGTQAGHEHDERERLRQEVVGTGVERLGLVPLAGLGREHEDRRPHPFGPQGAAHLEAVHARQQQVEHDRRVRALPRPPEAVGAVVGDLDRESLGGEPPGDGVGQRDLVLHHQHAHRTMMAVRRARHGRGR